MNDPVKNEPEAIRSEIDDTRRRMDNTMDALSERLQPRHLLDEALGFLRGSSADGESRLTHMREKLTHSCDAAMHSVADTVKKNPLPALVIGAGVAWMIYNNSRKEDAYGYETDDYSMEDFSRRYDPDTHYDRPLDYPSSSATGETWSEEGESKFGAMKSKLTEKASAAGEQVKEKLSHASEAARERMNALRGRAGEMSSRMRESTRHAYARSRERVVATAETHPLEVGLVALAAGLMVGLAMRTPAAVNRKLGPAADRLRERTREAGAEMLEKGKRVAQAAASAVKDEAEAQGLTPEALKEKASAVANRAREAGEETAEREGLTQGGQGSTQSNPPTYQPASDPSVARPAI